VDIICVHQSEHVSRWRSYNSLISWLWPEESTLHDVTLSHSVIYDVIRHAKRLPGFYSISLYFQFNLIILLA